MSERLPEGWEQTSIEKLTEFNSLFSDGDWVESKDQDSKGKNSLIQLADIGDSVFIDKSRRFMNDEQFSRLNCTKLKKGDILIARMPEPLGRACLFPLDNGNFATVVDVAILRTPNADHYWLMTVVNSQEFRRQIESNAAGSTRTRIARKILSKIKLIGPPLPQQQKIARILSTVDAVIEKTEAAIAKYKAIKAGMMHNLFTRGIDDNGQLRPAYEDAPECYKQTPLGWIPKEWEVEEMDNISLLMTNGFVGVATPFYANNENGIIYLYGNNIRKNKIDLNKTEKIKIEFHNKLKKSQLQPNDMLTVQSGHIGTSAIVPDGFPVANCHALIITRFKNNVVIPSYVSYYINSELGMRRMESIFVGSTIKHVNVKEFKEHSIPLAPLKEQAEIKLRIDSTLKRIELEQNILNKYQKLKQGLMQDLLTGKVKVNLDTTH
jgi:type I restriction enzyme S subunit